MICWLRRTWATTWRSLPPLQMIIAIIIVMFYSIFFCCSIWTLIRVCVGLAIPHQSSLFLTWSRGLTPIWAQEVCTHTFTCTLCSAAGRKFKFGEMVWGKEGEGLRNHFISVLGFLGSALVPLGFFFFFFFGAVRDCVLFLSDLSLGFLVSSGCVATHLPLGVNCHFLWTAKTEKNFWREVTFLVTTESVQTF